MTQEHPITPPLELVQQWVNDFAPKGMMAIATQAARWGADQELEACCEWLRHGLPYESHADYLRDARRLKPPSLKEQSIALIDKIQGNKEMWDIRDLDVIRQALEYLPD
jgi:hypothetical protein